MVGPSLGSKGAAERRRRREGAGASPGPRGGSTLERLWGRRVLVPLLGARGSLALLKSRATSRVRHWTKMLASVFTAS